ncbi:unnamed protein product [Sphagnum tenellum]
MESFETPKPSGCGPREQTVALHRAYEPNASSCCKLPIASLLPNCSVIGSLQDVTERLCSTHKVESLSLVGGLDGHIHQDKAPVEKQPSATVQPASLQTNKWPSSICHPQPQRPLNGESISLKSLFGQKSQYPPAKGHVEEESIIPSWHPASHIFLASFGQKNELHQVLKEEGRASNLQYDCLSFVSAHH